MTPLPESILGFKSIIQHTFRTYKVFRIRPACIVPERSRSGTGERSFYIPYPLMSFAMSDSRLDYAVFVSKCHKNDTTFVATQELFLANAHA